MALWLLQLGFMLQPGGDKRETLWTLRAAIGSCDADGWDVAWISMQNSCFFGTKPAKPPVGTPSLAGPDQCADSLMVAHILWMWTGRVK